VESPNRNADSEVSVDERRRLPRVSLSTEQFRLATNGKVFAVADLSRDGMAIRLLNLEDRVLFPIGSTVDGLLNLGRRKHRVFASVRNLRGDHVGCEFTSLEAEFRQELDRWLHPADLGQSLRLMPTPVGMGSGQFDWIWFHGRGGTELLAKLPQGWGDFQGQMPEKMLVVLWGAQYVEWSISTGVVTGGVRVADAHDAVQGVLRVAPEWFSPDATLDPVKLNLAKTLVNHSNLPDRWKQWARESGMPNP
jgi:hypothetical protein